MSIKLLKNKNQGKQGPIASTVGPPISDHPKCQVLVVACGRWPLSIGQTTEGQVSGGGGGGGGGGSGHQLMVVS